MSAKGFFLLEQPYEVMLGLAAKDGFKPAKVGQQPKDLLSGKMETALPTPSSQTIDKICQWINRYTNLTSEDQHERLMEEIIAESASPREALEITATIGENAAPSPRWKKVTALDISLSHEDKLSQRKWLESCLDVYRPFPEINGLAFQGLHLTSGIYELMLKVVKDLDTYSGFGDNDYQCPGGVCKGWEVSAFKPLIKCHLKGSSQKAMTFNMLLSDAECVTLGVELKSVLRELDPRLILGAAPYRVIMASFLNKVAMGIVTPSGWHELKPGQTLRQLYDEVM